jgi:hypothetical protein
MACLDAMLCYATLLRLIHSCLSWSLHLAFHYRQSAPRILRRTPYVQRASDLEADLTGARRVFSILGYESC